MSELRFDGRTAIVTGAGGNPSLGRAHALLLAARGANVVVNDIGCDPETPGYSGTASAEAVAEEIRARGGNAVANSHSVATEAGAAAVVQSALDAFGSVDILVNNAGISIPAAFDEMTSRDFQRHIDINLMASVWTCRAAWPHMCAKGYGRIVNTGSGAFTGFALLTAYGISKGGVFSLTRALAAEGAKLGIKVNTVLPGAFTRMVDAQQEPTSPMYQYAKHNLPAELVSPVVAYLAHESCPVTGESIEAVGGEVRRVYVAQTRGFSDRELSIETVAARWHEVMAGTAESVIGCGVHDVTTWNIKPYRPHRSSASSVRPEPVEGPRIRAGGSMGSAQRKVALVTGASSGIGRATAELFVARGYATALVDRDEALGREVESQLRSSGECMFIRCDVTDDEAVRRTVEQVVKIYGRLDAAFNAAGIDGEHGKGLADSSMENWNRVIAIDLTGMFSCLRYEIAQMLKNGGGAIVNCASVAGIVGAPFVSAYVAAKHGVVGLTKTAALEYATQGIRVNAVCPGMIDTPMSRKGMTPEITAALLKESPTGRLGQPSEIGTVVLSLCDPNSSFLTGQAIAVDGAWTAR